MGSTSRPPRWKIISMRYFSALSTEFIAWLRREVEAGRKRPRTLAYYQDQLRGALRILGHMEVERITALDVSMATTSWHSLQALQRLFNWAVEMGVLPTSPAARLKLPQLGQRERILSPEEQARCLRAARGTARLILLFQRETLARPGEPRALVWRQYRPQERCFALRQFKAKDRRKDRARYRFLLLTPRAYRLVERLRRRAELVGLAGPEDPVFLTARGTAWSAEALRSQVRRICDRVGIPMVDGENVVPYTFRHTAATHATANGVADRLLADLMGHTSTRTTARYQHLQLDHLRAGLERATRRR